MLGWLTGQTSLDRKASELYGRVVAAARQPSFYRDLGVSDTPEGRFELVALHLFLILERMRQSEADEALAQRAIEVFITDMDDNLREMGVGDLTVPKKVKRAAAAFYERAASFREAMANGDDDALTAALRHYVYQDDVATGQSHGEALANYVRRRATTLAAEPTTSMLSRDVPIMPSGTNGTL